MRIVDCEQGTPEWFAARCGRVTASKIADVTARTKTGWGASRANYMAQLVAERLTGAVQESYSNAAMQWGKDHEAEAARIYAFERSVVVTPIAFVLHPTIDDAGASPDRLAGDNGLVEIKCPNTATHIETLLGCAIDSKYIKQMQWQMLCTGRAWCDFVSFDPRLPVEMQLHVTRVDRDDKVISDIEDAVRVFLAELDNMMSNLRSRYMQEAA